MMKLNDIHYYNYFVDSTLKILNLLGDKSSRQDIEDKIKKDDFYLCFPNFKNSKWWLGIWPVGDWNFEDEYAGKVYKSGYGISNYNPHTIIVFLIHKWVLDKFRPTYSNWNMCISDNNDYELMDSVKSVQQFINNLGEDGINETTGKGLAPKTIKCYLSFISDIFLYAIRMEC